MKNPTPVMPDIIISEAWISKLLKNLNPRKAAGPDRIKLAMLQEFREELAPILKILFVKSFQMDQFQMIGHPLNSYCVTIVKTCDKSSAANYRPISLTCILCKVMEHIIESP